tara:strand:+ start:55 stop:585 length:531 start_codon:yes stop_codon:yes gene_type:complete
MKRNFTQSFKMQAVEKALSRNSSTSLKDVSVSLGIGFSTLNKWIVKARNQEFEPVSSDKLSCMTKDKRPQDWTLEERLNMIVVCSSLSDEGLSEHCREQGIYSHQVNQWKHDFVSGKTQENKVVSPSEVKTLKHQNKALKKELHRKDKALAETAALLVLQKKVKEIWGDGDEDSSQ